ncbi:MAG: topoisomerase C-terminal repeat-containing protein [Bacteroidales bacterium]|nr:topoisomerase C-terminal repeat-containing protein [Bacteroidales bacterium]
MAEKVAKAVGADNLQRGYYEGSGYYVTWAAGHLLEENVPEAEGEWKIEKLPILPKKFNLIVRQEKIAGKKTTSKLAEQRLFVIRYLLSRSKAIINAGDPGIEGELIQREILEYLQNTLPVWRLWYSSTSTKGLQEAMQDLHPSSDFDSLYEAAKSRSEADWLVGINATIALTCSTESNRTLSLGRVQTPVLSMVCRRFIEHENFTPEPYWKINLNVSNNKGFPFNVTSKRFSNRDEAINAAQNAGEDENAYVQDYKQETIHDAPPLLYDLTELIKAAIRRHGLNSEDVTTSAQALYMNGYISYPRTPSQYITQHEYDEMPELIAGLENYETFSIHASNLRGAKLNDHCVNELKVTDHFGLIITERIPDPTQLDDNSRIVYELIAERTLEAFSPDSIRERRSVIINAGDNEYKATSSVIMTPGWRSIRGVNINESEANQIRNEEDIDLNGDEITMNIPPLHVNENAFINNVEVLSGMTTAPPLYTEATLYTAMKNAGAKPDQDAQLKGLQKGLGTPATRPEIIKTLLNREYIIKSGPKKNIEPTILGLSVFKIVKDKVIADAQMTAQWEEALENIIDGRISAADFNSQIRIFTSQLIEQLIMGDHKNDIMQSLEKEVIECPNCGKKNYTSPKGYFCKSCDFKIYRVIASKKLSDNQLRNLLEIGVTQEIQGFKRKDGSTFNATLRREGSKIFFGKK